MKIANETVVSMHYTLTDDEGATVDSSAGREPLTFLQGAGNIIRGLEEALLGKVAGDKFKVSLTPEKGYGQRDERLVQAIPKNQFQGAPELKEGMQFQVNTQSGPMIFTIVGFKGDDVVVDGNSEMAGKNLHFEIEITNVRQATQEEVSHGHVHGPGGHHHG